MTVEISTDGGRRAGGADGCRATTVSLSAAALAPAARLRCARHRSSLWPIVMTFVYAVVPPPASNVMIIRLFTGNGITYDWVSLDQISPNLPRAVISSEDARFC